MSRLLSSSLLFFLVVSVTARSQTSLSVAAAADVAPLTSSLEDGFRKIDPAVRVRFVNGASAMLAQQIEHGAPYDVFLSANAAYVDQLASSGKITPESVKTYAVGRVAILWRDGKRHELRELTADWVRFIALPNPQLAPYGVAARDALRHEGLWGGVERKVVYGENVRQALQLFTSGNADVVLTAASLVHEKGPELIPAEWHQPILQKAGVAAASSNRAESRKFIEFLVSPAGQAVFAKFGFGSAAPAAR